MNSHTAMISVKIFNYDYNLVLHTASDLNILPSTIYKDISQKARMGNFKLLELPIKPLKIPTITKKSTVKISKQVQLRLYLTPNFYITTVFLLLDTNVNDLILSSRTLNKYQSIINYDSNIASFNWKDKTVTIDLIEVRTADLNPVRHVKFHDTPAQVKSFVHDI